MDDNLIIFQKFISEELASPIIELLKKNKIPFSLTESKSPYDPANFSGQAKAEFILKTRAEDFDFIDQLLLESAEQNLGDIEEHHLRQLSNEALLEILMKPDEWSKPDYLVARALLKTRGKNVDDDLLSALRKQRIEDLAKPEPDQQAWVAAGYLFSMIGASLVFSLAYIYGNQPRFYQMVKEFFLTVLRIKNKVKLFLF